MTLLEVMGAKTPTSVPVHLYMMKEEEEDAHEPRKNYTWKMATTIAATIAQALLIDIKGSMSSVWNYFVLLS